MPMPAAAADFVYCIDITMRVDYFRFCRICACLPLRRRDNIQRAAQARYAMACAQRYSHVSDRCYAQPLLDAARHDGATASICSRMPAIICHAALHDGAALDVRRALICRYAQLRALSGMQQHTRSHAQRCEVTPRYACGAVRACGSACVAARFAAMRAAAPPLRCCC